MSLLVSRAQLATALFVALFGGILLLASPLRAADPTPIACPNGQTVFLEGSAPPREPLLVYLGGRAVGGGLADANGTYRLPLRAQERPGSYPVEVRLRSSRAVIERFTCFVNVPIGSGPTETPTGLPTPGATTRVSPTQPPQVTRAPVITLSPTTTSATVVGGTPSVTPTGPTATPTLTGTAGPSPTSTGTPPAGNVTPTPRTGDVVILDVLVIDPAFPDDEEFVQISNTSDRAINLAGWRLINASRPDATRASVPPFVFPTFSLGPSADLLVFSLPGQNDLNSSDFYWGQSGAIWKAGDRVELRDARNTLVHSFPVPAQ